VLAGGEQGNEPGDRSGASGAGEHGGHERHADGGARAHKSRPPEGGGRRHTSTGRTRQQRGDHGGPRTGGRARGRKGS
ncbi:SAM-dependent methyltransferase, partial [Mycobacterium tuberculosis]